MKLRGSRELATNNSSTFTANLRHCIAFRNEFPVEIGLSPVETKRDAGGGALCFSAALFSQRVGVEAGSLPEGAKTDAHLNRVDPGIRVAHAGVRNVLEAHFRAEVVFFAEEMRADAAAGGEIDL